MVMVNSPNNPTGAVIPPDEFAKILDVCKQKHVWLLSDECYSHFTYGEAKPFSIASVAGAKENTIIADRLETFCYDRLADGYVLAPKPLADAVAKLQSQSTSNPNSITQYAALEAMRGGMDTVVTMLAEYARRRESILAGCARYPELLAPRRTARSMRFPTLARTSANKCRTTWLWPSSF